MNKLIIFLINLTVVLAFPRRKYAVTYKEIDAEGITVDTGLEKNALGTCTCDITRGSCDAYCCCDPDCIPAIKEIWEANYDLICAKNYIGAAFAPEARCLGSQYIDRYTKRMGMEVKKDVA